MRRSILELAFGVVVAALFFRLGYIEGRDSSNPFDEWARSLGKLASDEMIKNFPDLDTTCPDCGERMEIHPSDPSRLLCNHCGATRIIGEVSDPASD